MKPELSPSIPAPLSWLCSVLTISSTIPISDGRRRVFVLYPHPYDAYLPPSSLSPPQLLFPSLYNRWSGVHRKTAASHSIDVAAVAASAAPASAAACAAAFAEAASAASAAPSPEAGFAAAAAESFAAAAAPPARTLAPFAASPVSFGRVMVLGRVSGPSSSYSRYPPPPPSTPMLPPMPPTRRLFPLPRCPSFLHHPGVEVAQKTVLPPVASQERSVAPVQQAPVLVSALSTPAASKRGDSSSRTLVDVPGLQEPLECRDRDRRSRRRSTSRLRSPGGR